MVWSFRAKLLSLVGIAALAFILVIAAGAVIGRRVEQQLAAIQGTYLPKVELEPQLVADFEQTRRAFQDAVAIRDLDELKAAGEARDRMVRQLEAARDAVDPADARAAKAALAEYYAAADDVSRRLIAGETGEGLVDALRSMQVKQARVSERIEKAAALDRRALADAFSAATHAEVTARSYQLWISVACLVAVVATSLVLSRGVLRAVEGLTEGFQRFGGGDFTQPIGVSRRDELGSLAEHANRMAARLERLVQERERAESALKTANRELEAFSYSVAHDLRAPLRGINGFSRALLDDYGDKLDDEGKDYLQRVAAAAQRMGQLIDALLTLSRVTRAELHRERVDVSRLADAVIRQLRQAQPDRVVDFVGQEGVSAEGDPPLLRAVLENLLGNAWKFTGGREGARIAFGREERDGEGVYYVRDNGAGFDMAYAEKLFAPFQRLHSTAEFAGTGIGLATVQRIVHRHGGRIWAEGAVGRGATFYFTLPRAREGAPS